MRLMVPQGTGRKLRERVKGEEGRETGNGKRDERSGGEGGKEVKDGWDGAMGCSTHVTQMVKQSADPMKAMIESKAGKAIEMAKNIKIVTMRTAIFIMPRK